VTSSPPPSRDESGRSASRSPKAGRRAPRWPWVVGFLALLGIAFYFEANHYLAHAQSILRDRVVETLSARFKTKVELAELDVWLADGLNVSGKGLKIFGPTDPNPSQLGVQPLISVPEFHFQTGLSSLVGSSLLRSAMHVDTVHVKGMVLNIPPPKDQGRLSEMGDDSGKQMMSSMKTSMFVGKFVCEDTELIINTSKPGKKPLDFQIGHLEMKEIGPGQPLRFEATLVNPTPKGNIRSAGTFGPFREDSPRETPVAGDYSFTQVDLGTLNGISGTLSSTGKYSGTLGRIEVSGATDTPDFRVAVSGHPVALHTDFHAIVDGMDGDTYLNPVKARFLHSTFIANGKVIRVTDPPGRDIELDVVTDHARIEDLLRIGVKTDPPVLSGAVEMKTKLSLLPGPEAIANRLRLDGDFRVTGGQFSNKKMQSGIDSLSLRSRGEPQQANEHAEVGVPSELNGTFRLDRGLLTFPVLQFAVPGTHADVSGQYTLDGNTFDFHGKLRLDAKLSQMITGWKSKMLKAVDPIFSKHGAGTEVPFEVSGTRDAPHFGLDLGHVKVEAGKEGPSTPAPF
jgi:hypothetical protein